MSGVFDVDAIEQLIGDGRARHLSNRQLAEQLLALAEDPTWAKAISNPLRAQILGLLRREGSLSPSRAAEQLDGDSLGAIAYHFRYLHKLALIEVCDEIQRRGTVEHVYQLTRS